MNNKNKLEKLNKQSWFFGGVFVNFYIPFFFLSLHKRTVTGGLSN